MNRDVIGDIGFALGIVVLALAASAARRAGYINQETVTRLVIGATGLMIAYFGNRMPKAFVPNAQARRIKRVAGWSLVVSGLIYTALFAFAPLPIACWGGSAAVLAGIAITILYGIALCNKAKAA